MKTTRLAKLRRKPYRDAYVKAHLEQGLAFQIKEMRVSRGLTQRQLAKELDLGSQSAVARLEDPSYGRMSLATLSKVAAFFDVAFMAKMVPYSRFLAEVKDVSPRALLVDSFTVEDAAGAIENAPEFRLIPLVNNSFSTATVTINVWPTRIGVVRAEKADPRLRYQGTLSTGQFNGIKFNTIDMVLSEVNADAA
jgi:transcriptional regulator with XRE-family HTH domain